MALVQSVSVIYSDVIRFEILAPAAAAGAVRKMCAHDCASIEEIDAD